jgi:hypothetical protein
MQARQTRQELVEVDPIVIRTVAPQPANDQNAYECAGEETGEYAQYPVLEKLQRLRPIEETADDQISAQDEEPIDREIAK